MRLLFFSYASALPDRRRQSTASEISSVSASRRRGSDRLGNESSSSGHTTSGLFTCAICQVDLAPSEGISVHAGSIFSTSAKPWQGPFLCAACRNKKDAMEGKRPSGVKVL